ncbi:hypothetical protein GWK47_014425 [Chionoecetes opilio]|uniref:Uncharacterized protein n=1 Tax=Chionoecetes opilio TaxID=41210 RepID=A0A8J4XUQ1_CHIOP|nr:hypothetical protein GWK47_014425 [Chionoecetes opilio]
MATLATQVLALARGHTDDEPRCLVVVVVSAVAGCAVAPAPLDPPPCCSRHSARHSCPAPTTPSTCLGFLDSQRNRNKNQNLGPRCQSGQGYSLKGQSGLLVVVLWKSSLVKGYSEGAVLFKWYPEEAVFGQGIPGRGSLSQGVFLKGQSWSRGITASGVWSRGIPEGAVLRQGGGGILKVQSWSRGILKGQSGQGVFLKRQVLVKGYF